MKLMFLGAAHEVTGSCTLIEINGHFGTVDFGMEQGSDTFVNRELPVNAADLDFVLLTHAHIDHSGNLPLLYKNGFRGSIYATESTCDLCNIMLRDCAHIQESEAAWQSRKAKRAGRGEVAPVYDMQDAEGAIKLLRRCNYGERIEVAEGLDIRFSDIGHLLGSACIEIWMTEGGVTKKAVFSGDVGNKNQPILRDPSKIHDADIVVIESTYGDRLHSKETPDYIGALTDFIQRTFDRGGNLVIPSFAVGRTQEMLYFIREIKERRLVHGHDGFKVYVDSPLANEATGIFVQTDRSYFDEATQDLLSRGINPLMFDGLEISLTDEDSKAINADMTPKVIISASGMCEAGRIRHHLKHNLWRRDSTVLFVGYQAVGTLGRAIYDGAKHVKIFGEDISVNAEIALLPAISGHADKSGLLDWLGGFEKKPARVFVNHGEDGVCDSFAKSITAAFDIPAIAPYSGAVFDVLSGEMLESPQGIPIKKSARRRSNDSYKKLTDALERLGALVKRSSGMANKDLGKFTTQINNLCDKWEK